MCVRVLIKSAKWQKKNDQKPEAEPPQYKTEGAHSSNLNTQDSYWVQITTRQRSTPVIVKNN